jgi:hypothetical protein
VASVVVSIVLPRSLSLTWIAAPLSATARVHEAAGSSRRAQDPALRLRAHGELRHLAVDRGRRSASAEILGTIGQAREHRRAVRARRHAERSAPERRRAKARDRDCRRHRLRRRRRCAHLRALDRVALNVHHAARERRAGNERDRREERSLRAEHEGIGACFREPLGADDRAIGPRLEPRQLRLTRGVRGHAPRRGKARARELHARSRQGLPRGTGAHVQGDGGFDVPLTGTGQGRGKEATERQSARQPGSQRPNHVSPLLENGSRSNIHRFRQSDERARTWFWARSAAFFFMVGSAGR